MHLAEFSVEGFKSLQDVKELSLGKPAILTGHNDGGKTATIAALRFLLKGSMLATEDRTYDRDPVYDEEDAERELPVRMKRTCVTGRFYLSVEERERLGLPADVEIRRVSVEGGAASLEIKALVPKDEELRDLNRLKLPEMKALATARAVSNEGPARERASWLTPLQRLADESPQVSEWASAPADVGRALPLFVEFASTAEPHPEQEAARALRSAFDSLVKSEALVGQLRELEEQVTEGLIAEASTLASHIRERCPDLTSVSISPRMSFNEGYQGVTMRASSEAGEEVTLGGAGAGRRRRITLAVWEWTTQLLDESAFSSGVVVAYDEPDTHLDYRHQRQLMDLIHDQCKRDHVQMIVATHSMNLIDRVDISDVQHLTLEDGRTVLTRLVDDSHSGVDAYLSELASALGLRNSVLLHERCFVAVEGPTESQAFPVLFRAAVGMSLQAAGIALIACNGNEGALRVSRFLHERKRRVAFVVDRDSESNRSTRALFRLDKLRSYGFDESQIHYVGDPLELEDLFTDEQWADTANANWPQDDGSQWSPAAIRNLRGPKFGDRLLSEFRTASTSGPSSKPELVTTVASRITSADDVPVQLRGVFDKLVALARD